MAVISIRQNADFYARIAKEKAAKKDYSGAIEEILRATSLSAAREYRVFLAELYFDVGAYAEAANIYLYLFAKEPFLSYIPAFSRCLLKTESKKDVLTFLKNTYYSMHTALLNNAVKELEKGGGNDGFVALFDELREEEPTPFTVIHTADRMNAVHLAAAREALEDADFDLAVLHALQVSPKSKYYLEAQSVLADSAVCNGDKDIAVTAAGVLYAADPLSEAALHAYRAYRVLPAGGRFSLNALYCGYMDAANAAGSADALLSAAACMMLFEDRALLFEAVSAAYALCPVRDDVLFTASTAAFLCGKRKEGKRFAARYFALYPYSLRAKLCLWAAQNKLSAEERKNIYYARTDGAVDDWLATDYLEVRALVFEGNGNYVGVTAAYLDSLERAMYTNRFLLHMQWDVRDILKTRARDIRPFLIEKLASEIPDDVKFQIIGVFLDAGIAVPQCSIRTRAFVITVRLRPMQLPDIPQRPLFLAAYTLLVQNLIRYGGSLHYTLIDRIIAEMSQAGGTLATVRILAATAHYHYDQQNEEDAPLDIYADIYQCTAASIRKYIKNYPVNNRK